MNEPVKRLGKSSDEFELELENVIMRRLSMCITVIDPSVTERIFSNTQFYTSFCHLCHFSSCYH